MKGLLSSVKRGIGEGGVGRMGGVWMWWVGYVVFEGGKRWMMLL